MKKVLFCLSIFSTSFVFCSNALAASPEHKSISTLIASELTDPDQSAVNNANKKSSAKVSEQSKKAEQMTLEQEPTKSNAEDRPFALMLYRPTYILPVYYTGSPDAEVYQGNTPDNQKIKNLEFKAQLSFQVPVIKDLFNYNSLSLDAAYTQLSYWQFYASSQFFRETDYEPELFIQEKLPDDQTLSVGVDHESNGRGGELERSWNRTYINYAITKDNWKFAVRPWMLIFQDESSDLHNPDIAKFLGYGWIVTSYKFHNQTISLMLRNNMESGFKRGAEEVDWSIPIHNHFNFFVQGFSGYGQSLIEYNHYTNSIGFGLSLNNWM